MRNDEKPGLPQSTGKIDEKRGASTVCSIFRSAPFRIGWLILISEFLFYLSESRGINIYQPAISPDFGFIKDLADVFIVLIFSWHGWVVLIPLLFEAFVEINIKRFVVIYTLSTLMTSSIATALNFSQPTMHRLASGVLTYALINFVVGIFLISLFYLIGRFRNA